MPNPRPIPILSLTLTLNPNQVIAEKEALYACDHRSNTHPHPGPGPNPKPNPNPNPNPNHTPNQVRPPLHHPIPRYLLRRAGEP